MEETQSTDKIPHRGPGQCGRTDDHGPHEGVDGKRWRTGYTCPGLATDELVTPLPDDGTTLEEIASLLIRQYLDIVDGDTNPVHMSMTPQRIADEIMAWAVATAGHLFDGHVLNDYGLLSDADHFHRCVTHKHLRGDW